MQIVTKRDIDEAIESISVKIPLYKTSETLLSKFTDSEEDQEAKSYIGAKAEDYTKFLPLLIEHFNLKNIVELGNREGRSTLCMYDKLGKDSLFTTIDIEKDQRYCPDVMYSDPRVKFIFGDICDLSIFGDQIPMDIDLLFTDTIHFDFQLRDEFAVYEHLLADVALVAIDDINVNDKRGLFDEITFDKWDLTNLCHPSGWGLFLYKRKVPLDKKDRLIKAFSASANVWKRKFDEINFQKEKNESRTFYNKAKKIITKYPRLRKHLLSIRKLIRSI